LRTRSSSGGTELPRIAHAFAAGGSKDKDNVYIYISGTGGVRQVEELAGCIGGEPGANPETALFRIDIIKVPLAHPELAKIVSSPRIFADEKSGALNGLWKGGTHARARRPRHHGQMPRHHDLFGGGPGGGRVFR